MDEKKEELNQKKIEEVNNKDLVEQYDEKELEFSKFKVRKKILKAYKSKIKYNGAKRLLQIETYNTDIPFYDVSVKKFSERFDTAYISKSFGNFKDALNLFTDLKEKYNGKKILVPLSIRSGIIAIGSGAVVGLIIGKVILALLL